MRRLAFLAFLLAFALTPRRLTAQTVPAWTFEDGDLVGWRAVLPAPGGSYELRRVDAAGNPYLEMRHTHDGPFNSTLVSVVVHDGWRHDPRTSGPIRYLAYAAGLRARLGAAGPAGLRGVSLHPALVQNQTVYATVAPLGSVVPTLAVSSWLPGSVQSLVAASFDRFAGAGSHPDFSETAAPITFGFLIRSSQQTSSPNPIYGELFAQLDDLAVGVTADAPGIASVGFDPAFVGEFTADALLALERARADFGISLQIPLLRSRVLEEETEVRVRIERPEGASEELDVVIPAGRIGAVRSFQSELLSDCALAEVRVRILSAGSSPVVQPALLRYFVMLADPTVYVSREDNGDQICPLLPISNVWEHEEHTVLYPACYEYLGLPTGQAAPAPTRAAQLAGDGDGGLLTPLRSFRDDFLAQSAVGRYYSALYYTHGQALLDAVFRRPGLVLDIVETATLWLDGIAALTRGEGGTRTLGAEPLARLLDLASQLEAVGSPALARVVRRERERLEIATWAGLDFAEVWQRVVERGGAEPCVAGDRTLCLNGGRYAVEADFTTFEGAVGQARAVPLSGDSGYFWFFDEDNVEILAKVLQGCGINDHVWSYNAGLTNLDVDLFVLDTATGRGKVYRNEGGESFAPILDSDFVACADAPAGAMAPTPVRTPVNIGAAATGDCLADATTLCLLDGRFRVTATFRTATGESGSAHASPLTAETGTFWFFDPQNVELVVKAIDACGLAGFENFWLFAAGTTDVEVELRVEDTVAAAERIYRRRLGTPFEPILDTAAFATCP